LPEVVGNAGLLVDPLSVSSIADGIVRLATDVELRETLRERGLKHVAGRTWERSATETLAVFERVAALK
jgi:glycosyltransferase involved in cell wall biosynthesis